jgi:hypothetical protein
MSAGMQFLFVAVILKYFNFVTFSKYLLLEGGKLIDNINIRRHECAATKMLTVNLAKVSLNQIQFNFRMK